MGWPALNDYAEAFQNPNLALNDPDLKTGRVTLGKYGMPKPISGNFAIVFEVSNGLKKWAVRCFVKNIPGQEQRYALVSKRLSEASLESTVGFEFLAQGIRIKGAWYPVVKMEWIEGHCLDVYIRENLHNPSAIRALVENWLTLSTDLRSHGIAHGDLQHGNILVTTQGQVKLVDYDGIYVPGSADQKSNEIGHRNYQHPSRTDESAITEDNYLNIDNFSNWVIGVSMGLLCLDPHLWHATRAGDENLLFRSEDFKQLYRTETWRLLMEHRDRRVRELGRTLADVCQERHFLDVPPLNPFLLKEAAQSTPAPTWITDHLQTGSEPRPLDFPEKFISAGRSAIQSEFKKLPLAERLRFRLQWQNYVPEYVKQHYHDFSFARKKQRIESRVQTLESRKQAINSRLLAVHQALISIENRQHVDPRAQKEIDRLKRHLEIIPVRLAECDRQQQEEIAQRLSMWLRQFEIRPGLVSGIGEVRIACLTSVGVTTAADLISANEVQALDALRGIHGSIPLQDWHMLVTWRIGLENFWRTNPRTSAERQQIEAGYEERRQKLRRAQTVRKQRLVALEKASWLGAPSEPEYVKLQSEIGRLERERDHIDLQLERRAAELTRYARLTSQNLILKLVNA